MKTLIFYYLFSMFYVAGVMSQIKKEILPATKIGILIASPIIMPVQLGIFTQNHLLK